MRPSGGVGSRGRMREGRQMHRPGKATRTWVVGVLGLIAATADRAGAGDAKQATALLSQARPHLEAVLGCRLDTLPSIRPATEADGRQWDRPELELQVRGQFPD